MTRNSALDPAPSLAFLLCGSVGHPVSINLNFLLLREETIMVPRVRHGVESSLKGKSLGV